MQKISDVLKESDIHQVTGYLIKYDDISDKFEGKCALGVLACESGDEYLKLSKNHTTVGYGDILKAYDVVDDCVYPVLQHPDLTNKEVGWDFEDQVISISSIIIRLNDIFNFNFKEIGEFLEVTFDL